MNDNAKPFARSAFENDTNEPGVHWEPTLAERIKGLLTETRRWRAEHRSAGRDIEAWACAIRERALMDALGELWYGEHSTGKHL